MTKVRKDIKEIDIKKLKDYEKNNKIHPEEQISLLVQMIDKFGFTTPLLVDKNNVIIAGHGRKLAGERLGMKKLPCLVIDDLSDDEIRTLRIADNRIGELAENQMFNIKEEYFDLLESGSGIEFLTGYTEEDFNFLTEEEQGEVEEDDFEPPEDIEKVKTDIKQGDIIQLGNHRLMCGSATESKDVQTLANGELMDMLQTDPPYNVNYEGGTKEKLKIQNDKMDNDSFRIFLKDAFQNANDVMRAGGVFYIWHSDSEGYNFRGACFDIGWKVRQCLIWNKNQIVMGRQDYHWKHEPCIYGWKDGAAHIWSNDRKQSTVLDFNKPLRNGEHPTMKPLELVAYQIGNNTKTSNKVLDLFGGSGSTLIACEQLNRKCYMMELDPKYCEVIC